MMKHFAKFQIVIIALSLLLLGSWMNRPLPDLEGQTIYNLLVNNSWKKFSAKLYPYIDSTGDTITYNVFENTEECYLDDYFSFSNEGYVLVDEGETVCDTTVIVLDSMLWGFDIDTTKILIYSQDSLEKEEFEIDSITNDTLKLIFRMFDGRTEYTTKYIYNSLE